VGQPTSVQAWASSTAPVRSSLTLFAVNVASLVSQRPTRNVTIAGSPQSVLKVSARLSRPTSVPGDSCSVTYLDWSASCSAMPFLFFGMKTRTQACGWRF
jgi:hypothetical protein